MLITNTLDYYTRAEVSKKNVLYVIDTSVVAVAEEPVSTYTGKKVKIMSF